MELTVKFPLRSVDGYTATFILYDWTRNVILATSIKYSKYDTMVGAFTNNVEYMSARGFKPECNVMYNAALKAIRSYLKKENIKFQLVEPHNNRAKASECAIQTFKNHFISGLCIGDKAFPTIL